MKVNIYIDGVHFNELEKSKQNSEWVKFPDGTWHHIVPDPRFCDDGK